MSEEEKKGILFQIDMQLYNEFNDKFCEINEHLGDIYSYKDLEDIEQAENYKEKKLLREAIQKQEKVIDEMAKEIVDLSESLDLEGKSVNEEFENIEMTKKYFNRKVENNE